MRATVIPRRGRVPFERFTFAIQSPESCLRGKRTLCVRPKKSALSLSVSFPLPIPLPLPFPLPQGSFFRATVPKDAAKSTVRIPTVRVKPCI